MMTCQIPVSSSGHQRYQYVLMAGWGGGMGGLYCPRKSFPRDSLLSPESTRVPFDLPLRLPYCFKNLIKKLS